MTAGAALGEWAGPDVPAVVADAELAGVYLGAADAAEVVDPSLPIEPSAPEVTAGLDVPSAR